MTHQLRPGRLATLYAMLAAAGLTTLAAAVWVAWRAFR